MRTIGGPAVKFPFVLLMILLTTPSNLFSQGKSRGPFNVRYAAYQENASPKYKRIKETMRVIAENAVDGKVYTAEGTSPNVEIPPGFYRIHGSSQNCKLKERFTYILKNRKISLKALCI